jgi:hypothetical protein
MGGTPLGALSERSGEHQRSGGGHRDDRNTVDSAEFLAEAAVLAHELLKIMRRLVSSARTP